MMSQENPNINQPTIEELIAVCKPGVPSEVRASLEVKLRNSCSKDEALLGAIKFLEDTDYDFDALHDFLDVPIRLSKKKTPPIFNYKRALAIAASLIVLLGIIWPLLQKNIAEKEVANAAIHEPGLPVFATVAGEKDFNELMSAYRMQDAEAGLKFFNTLIKKQPKNDTLNYFGGWLYLINKQPDSAATRFRLTEKVIKGNYYYKAQYMEAISLYADKQQSLSKKLLEKIRMDKLSPYQQDAGHLLAKPELW